MLIRSVKVCLCEFSAEFWELIAVQFFYFVCSNAWK
jgi:hypothetical protein